MVEIWLNDAGYPYNCRIVASSGVASLDHQSCAVMLRSARYQPARDEAGEKVAAVSRRTLAWALNDLPPPAAPPPYDIEVSVTALPGGVKETIVPVREIRKPDGTAESCAAGRSDLNTQLVAIACRTFAGVRGPAVTDKHQHPIRYVRVCGGALHIVTR